MPEETSQKTTPSTTNTGKFIEPRVGSDEDMIRHGFHLSSQSEIQQYGKFLNREGFFSIAIGVVRRCLPRGAKTTWPEVVVISASQTEGSNPLPCHQEQRQFGTRQTEATSTVVFQV